MKISRKVQKTYIIAMFLVSLILAAAGTTAVYAKYVKDVPFSGNVHVEADLVDSLLLYESKASRTDLGDYSLTEANVTENSYILMPGVDVPKDPTIYISGKSAVPSYLYIEVAENNIPDTVTYKLESCWIPVSGVTGPNGGKVYYYNTVLDDSTADPATIGIIEGNTLYVSQTLDHSSTSVSYSLDFYAYMAQKNGEATAETVFTSNFLP